MAKRGNIIRSVTENPERFITERYNRKLGCYVRMATGATTRRYAPHARPDYGFAKTRAPHYALVRATLIKLGYRVI